MRILYIDIDSLRPDHLGCYGYGRPTSPNIDQLAARGVRLSRCYAANSPCVPSRAACFSGRPGIRSGVVAHENTLTGATMHYGNAERHGDAPMLAHRLSVAGYHTVTFTSFADRHLAGWFNLGFREVHMTSLKHGNEDAPEVTSQVVPWLRDNASSDDWFLHVNYWDPHTLYTEPPEYAAEMAKYPAPAWPDAATIARQQRDTGQRSAATLWGDNPHDGFGKSRVPLMPDNVRDRADFEKLINGYDGGVRFADDNVGLLLAELDRQGLLGETAVILSADHGEAFGELGQYAEHGSASTGTQHIPMVVAWPGVTDAAQGTTRDDLTLNTDFAPTILDALGLDKPAGWPGRSFLPALRGEAMAERDHVVWAHGLHTRQRAVFDGRLLFIRTYHPSWYLYPPRMLFDLESDPHQERDLAEQRPADVERMEATLLAWERENLAATGRPDPMRLAMSEPPPIAGMAAYLERLEREGRGDDADRLRDQLSRIDSEYAPANL